MKIHDAEQGSPEWWNARAGVPSASCFKKIITPGKGELSKSIGPYICELIEQRLSGTPTDLDEYMSRAMANGVNCEPEARRWYAFTRDTEVRQVGFCTTDDGRFGCSPDGLVGDFGGLELKCPTLRTHIGYLLDGGLPTEYKWQVHGGLWVTGREWWDFMSYAVGLEPLVVRVYRDDDTDRLGKALCEFWPLYESAWQQIKERLGDMPEPRRKVAEPIFM